MRYVIWAISGYKRYNLSLHARIVMDICMTVECKGGHKRVPEMGCAISEKKIN